MASTQPAPGTIERKAGASGVSATIAIAATSSTATPSGIPPETGLDALVAVVLDSAGVANRSASIAASSTESLLTAVGDLGKVVSRARMMSAIVLAVAMLSIVAAAGALFSVTVQMNGRLAQTNATLLAVGKRAVEMNTGVEHLKHIETTLSEMTSQQGIDPYPKVEAKLDAALAEIRKQISTPPPAEKPVKQDDARQQSVLTQIKALEAQTKALEAQTKALEFQTQAQTRSIARMSELIAASRVELTKATGVTRNVETLLAHFNEKQRAPAPAPAPAPPAPREREKPVEPKSRDYIQSKDYIQYTAPQSDKSDRSRTASPSADPAATVR
jgi:uncharacterized coiled-coil protein SlyX